MESINTVCENTNICNVWTEKKNVYRKMGNGIAFAGKQRYDDISCQNSQAVRLNLPSIVTVRLVSVASPYSGQVTNLDQSRSF